MKVTQSHSLPDMVTLTELDKCLIAEIQDGLPLVSRPYLHIAEKLGITEEAVIQRLHGFLEQDMIKRMGVVVRHRELGYRANAMVVWNIPDEDVTELGHCMGRFDFVTLCYQRPRCLPEWPYNLFTMIHGHDRDQALSHLNYMIEQCQLENIEHEALFSVKRFKQRGAIYQPKKV